MTNNINSKRFLFLSMASMIIFMGSIFHAKGQQMPGMNMDTSTTNHKNKNKMQDQMMLPMPFFTHMGIPFNVGSYGLRVAALRTKNEGLANSSYNFQFETGLSKTVGLFLGGENLFKDATLESMVQFLVWKSKNGMSGFSPIIEFEFPLGKEATRHVYTLVGFATTISNEHVAFNQVLHYSPIEDLEEGSASLVIKVSKRLFFVTELSGVVQKTESPVFNLLGGIKLKITNNFLLGFGYQLPLTTNRSYSQQYIFQPNILFQK